MIVYYTIPTNVSKETFSNSYNSFDFKENECNKILQIIKLYYDINKESLPDKEKESLEELLDFKDMLLLEKEDFEIIAPILERFLYNDGKIKEDQIVGLLLDSCYELNYITLTTDYAYSFQAGLRSCDVQEIYYFSQYKKLIHPAVWHIQNDVSTDFIIQYEEENKL